MNVEVEINSEIVARVEVSENNAYRIAEKMYDEYKIGVLQNRGVQCGVFICGVPSIMNDSENNIALHIS